MQGVRVQSVSVSDEQAVVRVDPAVDRGKAIAHMSTALEAAGFKGWDMSTEKRVKR